MGVIKEGERASIIMCAELVLPLSLALFFLAFSFDQCAFSLYLSGRTYTFILSRVIFRITTTTVVPRSFSYSALAHTAIPLECEACSASNINKVYCFTISSASKHFRSVRSAKIQRKLYRKRCFVGIEFHAQTVKRF